MNPASPSARAIVIGADRSEPLSMRLSALDEVVRAFPVKGSP